MPNWFSVSSELLTIKNKGIMFTIYRYTVGGRRFDRYFRSWKRAKEELEEELKNLLKSGWTQFDHSDYFNDAKGFYVFDYSLKTTNGELAILSLVDGHFSD